MIDILPYMAEPSLLRILGVLERVVSNRVHLTCFLGLLALRVEYSEFRTMENQPAEDQSAKRLSAKIA